MTRLKIALMILSLAVLPVPQIAQAKITVVGEPEAIQVPSQTSLQKLIQVLQFDKGLNNQLQQSKGMATQAIQQMLKDTLQDSQLTPNQLQQIEQATSDLMQKMIDEQSRPELRQKMIDTYQETLKENYSQAEIDAMISFYSSPIGQSIVNKQSLVSQAYGQKIMPVMIASTQATMKKLTPEYQKIIENIIKPNQKTNTHKMGKK